MPGGRGPRAFTRALARLKNRSGRSGPVFRFNSRGYFEGVRNSAAGMRLASLEPHSVAARLSAFYGALFLIYGAHLPYFPLWLNGRHLSASEISIIVAAPFFLRLMITPLLAVYADRHQSHRAMIIVQSWLALGLALVLSQMHGFWPVFLLAVPLAIATTSIMPLTETLAVSRVRADGLDYGRVRLWGSLTFVVMGLAGGWLVERAGGGVGVWLLIFGAVLTVHAAHNLPGLSSVAAPSQTARTPLTRADVMALAGNPLFLLFLLSVGCTQASHATFYTFGALHWQALGISSIAIGIMWAAAVLAEVALFAWSRPLIARFGPVELLIAGAAAAAVRWAIMSFDPPMIVLMPLQLLHALTYGATHLAAIHFIARAVPETAAGTAQALYASVAAGVIMGAATLVSGPLFAAYGGGAYVAPALLSLVGLAAAVALAKRWDGARIGTREPDIIPTTPVPGA
jgi:MFS transporter, PPP family, 3-phenylpropionic acid transporter